MSLHFPYPILINIVQKTLYQNQVLTFDIFFFLMKLGQDTYQDITAMSWLYVNFQ